MTSKSQVHRERFQKIETIFAALCDLPRDTPAEREHIEQELIALATGDAGVINDVRQMLDLDANESPIIDRPAIQIDPQAPDQSHPERIGPFTILSVLGEGGMGIVYEAQQQSPKRLVALKVIRERSVHARIKRRFQHEADILARLNHPGIATIYESGIAQENTTQTPYVAMELIVGQPITSYTTANALRTDQRINLLMQVCRAVGYAHSLGIVHRDLKPSNILVDADGHTKVLDFGIALDMQLEQRTMMTQTGQLLGTLQYMAPEQVDRQSNESSARTDVYALGLIAYELLLGVSPHAGRDASMYELVRAIRDDEPDTLGTHDRTLRGDLETIVAKALAREPERRYPDANALADDLDRYLANKPIEARKPSTWYQLRKFSQRNPVLVGSVASIMLVLVAAIVLIANALRIANDERIIAQQQQHAQKLIAQFVTEDLFSAGNPNFGGDADISLIDAMRQSSDKIPDRFKDAPEAEASISATMGDQFRLMNDYDKALLHLTRSLELSKQLPDIPADVLASRYINLIDLYSDIDDLERALEIVAELDQFVANHPELPPSSRVDILVQHASIHYYQRDLKSAAEIFEQAVAIGQSQAPDHTGTIDAIGALAMVYTNLERYEEAAPLHEKNIEMSIEMLGPENPGTLQSMDNYAIQLYRNNQPQEARELLEQVLELRLRVFGPDHHKTNLTRALIGRTSMLSGDYETAEPILLEAYERLINTLGEDHRYTVVARSILFDLYTALGNTEQAAAFAPPKPQSDPTQ